MQVIPWPETALFHNVRKYTLASSEILNGENKVLYYSKVKLHGSNCAIQYHKGDTLVCQSRTTVLTPTDDLNGFAKWVDKFQEQWKRLSFQTQQYECDTVSVYGEWCGAGVNKSNVAVSQIADKFFAVFAIRLISKDKDVLVDEPANIQDMLNEVKAANLHVIPWANFDNITVDWSAKDEDLTPLTEKISQWVDEVEKLDPWVKETFQVDGQGEGLVFYPRGQHCSLTGFQNLAFKSKGEKHQVIKTAKAAQVNPEVAANAEALVALVLPEARLEQGLGVIGADVKLTGTFVAWVWADVQKETSAELELARLSWKDVQKGIETKARSWFLGKVKK